MTEDPFLQWLLAERKEADDISIDMVIYKYSAIQKEREKECALNWQT